MRRKIKKEKDNLITETRNLSSNNNNNNNNIKGWQK